MLTITPEGRPAARHRGSRTVEGDRGAVRRRCRPQDCDRARPHPRHAARRGSRPSGRLEEVEGRRPPHGEVNRLADETSPYLRQHADNPVDWYPWGEEAFARARAEDKPILLSVGYSSCHWCHVMAHESFEDPDIAAIMNERFVNVKVDREERPDVDAVYMQAVQAMTGCGRLADDRLPRPRRAPVLRRHVLPEGGPSGNARLRARDGRGRRSVARAPRRPARAGRQAARRDRRSTEVAESATRAISPPTCSASRSPPSNAQFDQRFGGFGNAPKFPQAMTLAFLLSPGRARAVAGDARDDHGVARRDGRGRHVRPGRRRLPPLLGRRVLARPPLREDALRPGAAHPRLPARLARRRAPALPPHRRGDRRVRAPRPAPRRRRVLLRRGRRLRGRRGQVLPVVARGDRGAVRRRHGRGGPLLRRHRRRQLRGPAHPLPRQHPARRRPRGGPPRRRHRASCRGFSRPA